jgi:predicted neuraminidase
MAFYKNHPVFAWFGGTREGLPDSAIYVQYKGKVKALGTDVNMAYWNPILFTIEDELFLAYKRGDFCDRWTTYIINISKIQTMSDKRAQIIPAGLNFCVKTKPIIDSQGFIHCGSSVETKDDWTSYIEKYDYQDGEFIFDSRSKPLTVDKKKYIYDHPTYGKINLITKGIIQPSLWIDNHNCWHAFFRSSSGLGKIYHAKEDTSSWGDGEWSKPEPTQFDNPNSGIDTVYMNERLFLVYNPSKTSRSPLVFAELDDKFRIVDEMVIQEKTEGETLTSELSYPYMIENDGIINLVYTYGRSSIEYVTIEV